MPRILVSSIATLGILLVFFVSIAAGFHHGLAHIEPSGRLPLDLGLAGYFGAIEFFKILLVINAALLWKGGEVWRSIYFIVFSIIAFFISIDTGVHVALQLSPGSTVSTTLSELSPTWSEVIEIPVNVQIILFWNLIFQMLTMIPVVIIFVGDRFENSAASIRSNAPKETDMIDDEYFEGFKLCEQQVAGNPAPCHWSPIPSSGELMISKEQKLAFALQFLSEHVVKSSTGHVDFRDIKKAYENKCRGLGSVPLRPQKLGMILTNQRRHIRKTNGAPDGSPRYYGLILRNPTALY